MNKCIPSDVVLEALRVPPPLDVASASSSRPPVVYDSCGRPAQAGRFHINSSLPDPFGGSLSLVEAVCCDTRNRQYAEPQNLFSEVGLFRQMDSSGVTTFYDSASRLPVFRAPVNRSLADFEADTVEHGWPSFRTAEVVEANVVTDRVLGLVSSTSGTHLGSYLPDAKGARWCIDLACISGVVPHSRLSVYDYMSPSVE